MNTTDLANHIRSEECFFFVADTLAMVAWGDRSMPADQGLCWALACCEMELLPHVLDSGPAARALRYLQQERRKVLEALQQASVESEYIYLGQQIRLCQLFVAKVLDRMEGQHP